MSTRCQIRVIIDDKTHVDFYHHYDGYFEGVGDELQAVLAGCENGEELCSKLVAYDSEQYEHTDGLHGDIEYLYELDFRTGEHKGYKLDWTPWKADANFNQLSLVAQANVCKEPEAVLDLTNGMKEPY